MDETDINIASATVHKRRARPPSPASARVPTLTFILSWYTLTNSAASDLWRLGNAWRLLMRYTSYSFCSCANTACASVEGTVKRDNARVNVLLLQW